jgi:heme/copper-type cytochrome/quinol oxidase subunit 3
MSFDSPIAAAPRSGTGIPHGRLAMWNLLASEIVIFGGLVAAYLLYRFHNAYWAVEASHTNVVTGATNAFILLTSSLLIVLAQNAAEAGDGKQASKLMMGTFFGGILFLIVKSYEYANEIHHGLTITANPFWSFYYTATAIHSSHVIAGMIAIFIVSLDVAKGNNLQRVEICGIYWHFVDLVWILLFPLLYVVK